LSASNPIAPGVAPDPASSHGSTGAAAGETAAMLSRNALAQHLQRSDLDLKVIVSTASTNADLIARARIGAPPRAVLRAAMRQTAGRGRDNRAWHGSDTGSLLFSLALSWRSDPAASAAVTLAGGLAIAQCLHAHGVDVQLKWPNDVLLGGRKLAGILTQMADDPRGARTLVIGMGLNLVLDPAQRLAIEQPVAELAECFGREALLAARELWLARFAAAMIDAARRFDECGFAALRPRYNAWLAFLGQQVILQATDQAPLSGIVRGVDDQGRLLLECEDGLRALISGEMSLRAVPLGEDGGRRQLP